MDDIPYHLYYLFNKNNNLYYIFVFDTDKTGIKSDPRGLARERIAEFISSVETISF